MIREDRMMRKERKMESQIRIEVDTQDLDEALKKANELLERLKEVEQIIHSLSKPGR